MASLSSFHSSIGTHSFLGLRRTVQGGIEIVYDDGEARHRMIWRVASPEPNEARIGEALKLAVDQAKVLPALYAELKKRSIAIEAVTP